ncbi:MAG: flagellar basal body P-ring formation chaperone FlgA [Acidithiobacillus sp.]
MSTHNTMNPCFPKRLLKCFAMLLGAAGCLLTVSTAAQGDTENPETIRHVARQYVRAHLPVHTADAQIHISGPAAGLHFPACTRLKASYFGYGNPYGNQTVLVRCTAPSAWQLYLPVQIQMSQMVVIAATPLSAGTILSARDLTIVHRDTAGLSGSTLSNLHQAIGQVLRFGTLAGQPITTTMLDAPEVVHAGEQITLYAEGEGIRIATIADAIENGRPGQTILVRNLQSGRVVRGTVTPQGHVVVPF